MAQRLLRQDPLHEASYRCLMRLYAARGDRAAVSRTYQTCVTVLKRELAIEPGLTTRTTYEQLVRAEDEEEGANINAPMTFSGLPANAVPPAGHSSLMDKTPVVE